MNEVWKQMLEVLEYWDVHGGLHQPTEEAIQAGKQAIGELESQEPDYWLGYGLQAHTEKPFENATALYTHPPQRTWVGLTDDEFWELDKEDLSLRQFVQAIDDRLQEKNT